MLRFIISIIVLLFSWLFIDFKIGILRNIKINHAINFQLGEKDEIKVSIHNKRLKLKYKEKTRIHDTLKLYKLNKDTSIFLLKFISRI